MSKKLHLKIINVVCVFSLFVFHSCKRNYNFNYKSLKINNDELILEWDYPSGYYFNNEFISCFKLRIKLKEDNGKLYLYKNVNDKSTFFEINNKTNDTIDLESYGSNVQVESKKITGSSIYKIKFSNMDIPDSSCPFFFNGITLYYNMEDNIIGAYLFLDHNEIFDEEINMFIYNPIGRIYENFIKKDVKVIFDNKNDYKIIPASARL